MALDAREIRRVDIEQRIVERQVDADDAMHFIQRYLAAMCLYPPQQQGVSLEAQFTLAARRERCAHAMAGNAADQLVIDQARIDQVRDGKPLDLLEQPRDVMCRA